MKLNTDSSSNFQSSLMELDIQFLLTLPMGLDYLSALFPFEKIFLLIMLIGA